MPATPPTYAVEVGLVARASFCVQEDSDDMLQHIPDGGVLCLVAELQHRLWAVPFLAKELRHKQVPACCGFDSGPVSGPIQMSCVCWAARSCTQVGLFVPGAKLCQVSKLPFFDFSFALLDILRQNLEQADGAARGGQQSGYLAVGHGQGSPESGQDGLQPGRSFTPDRVGCSIAPAFPPGPEYVMTATGWICFMLFKTYCRWAKSLSLPLQNPGRMRFLCKCQPTMVSHGFNMVRTHFATIHSSGLASSAPSSRLALCCHCSV